MEHSPILDLGFCQEFYSIAVYTAQRLENFQMSHSTQIPDVIARPWDQCSPVVWSRVATPIAFNISQAS